MLKKKNVYFSFHSDTELLPLAQLDYSVKKYEAFGDLHPPPPPFPTYPSLFSISVSAAGGEARTSALYTVGTPVVWTEHLSCLFAMFSKETIVSVSSAVSL